MLISLIFATFLVIIIGLILILFLFSKSSRKKRLSQALNLKLLSVRLPQKAKPDEQAKDFFKNEINLSAQLFGILSGLKSPFGMEAAVHHIGEEIHFYVAAPKNSLESVSRQIEGLWKDAQVEQVGDYNIFSSGGVSQGVYLKQKISYALPFGTYNEAEVDTFAPILSGLSKISEAGEGAAIQILVKSADKSVKKTIFQMITNLKKGSNLEDILNVKFIGFSDIQKALQTKNKKQEKEEKIIDEEAIKSLENKISKPLLSVNFRVITSALNQEQADAVLEGITGAFSQFSAPLRNEIKIIKPRNLRDLIYKFCFREFDDKQTMVLNSEELASFFHLPTCATEIPRVRWLKSKEASPPANLPNAGTIIGESVFRGEQKTVYITDEDRRRHTYIIGQTGTGKSTLITNMVINDINQGKGVAVIDPHGDLIETILKQIPQERFEDVLIFDPSDMQKPLGLNMLEYDFNRSEEKTFIVNEMQSIFNKLFTAETMGPMFEQYMRNALLLLMEDMENEPTTLMEVPRVFTDVEFRQRKLSRIKNPTVIDFWEKEAIKAGGEASLANMTPYITSKFNNFTSNDYIRPIIGQPKSAFNFRQVMDQGKILLVNLSKGRIGEINAGLLGMVVTGKILMAALSRVDAPESKRRDFNLYIDEFQSFTTDSISTILSEARKYRLNLVIGHQFIAQLEEKIRDAVFGNVGSIIAFRVGVQDTEILVRQFEPVFNESDLLNIDNFNAYAKLLISGQTSKPFNIKTLFPKIGDETIADKLKELSRSKYGRDRQKIEEEILKRMRD